MVVLPKKRKREPMGLKQPSVLRVPAFLRYVRQHECACTVDYPPNNVRKCQASIEAAHVRIGTDGGVGMKPSDCHALPLCSDHHRQQHQIGERSFEMLYSISMRAIADGLWKQWLKTDSGRRWALKNDYRP